MRTEVLAPAARFSVMPREVAIVASEDGQLERLSEILTTGGFSVRASATTIEDLSGDTPPPAIVATLDMTVPAAVPALRQLCSASADAPLVIVSPPTGAIGVRRLLDAGAEGLVVDAEADQSLVPTLQAVVAGQVVVPRAAGRQLRKPALTFREKQVLGMVTLGFGNSEIADKLFLAESTVKSHLSSAFAKLGVRSRSEAAALILDPDGALGPGILAISPESAGASPESPNGQ
jgi:DNA-binding NarL/FixJ family response regulator